MQRLPARVATLVAAFLCLAVTPGAEASTPTFPALRSLQKALRADLKQAGGSDGVLVLDATTGQTLFAAAPGVERLPASVEKLYTTSTALLEFGPNARLTTGVYGTGTLDSSGTWHGTLYLRGGGDPTFGDAGFDQAAYGTGATVQALADQLAAAGIKRVAGRIVGDESYLDSLRGTPDTHYKADLEVEGELSGLAYDAGFQNGNEDSFQPRPALWAAQAFASVMRADRIKVPARTPIFSGITPQSARPLALVRSPTISTLIQLTNAPSDNFFAEMLLKDIGAKFGAGGTTADGAAIVRAVIAKHFGLYPMLNDGSGLSRSDHTSPQQIVSLLEQQQANQPFVDSLAVAGVSGTMQREMVGTRAADNCRGKTGTLHDVANLVGYCTAQNGDRLIFAFLLNRQHNSDFGHAVEDQMGEALANYDP